MSNTPSKPFVRPATTQDVNNIKPLAKTDDLDEVIIAKPLSMPQELDMKPKDKNVSLRWVNRKAGGGARYEQALAMGFQNAKVEDIITTTLVKGATIADDGNIVRHDVILMKMRRADYEGALKWNDQTATNRVERKTLNRGAKQAGQQELNGMPAEVLSKVNFYTPAADDAEKIVGPDKFENA